MWQRHPHWAPLPRGGWLVGSLGWPWLQQLSFASHHCDGLGSHRQGAGLGWRWSQQSFVLASLHVRRRFGLWIRAKGSRPQLRCIVLRRLQPSVLHDWVDREWWLERYVQFLVRKQAIMMSTHEHRCVNKKQVQQIVQRLERVRTSTARLVCVDLRTAFSELLSLKVIDTSQSNSSFILFSKQ